MAAFRRRADVRAAAAAALALAALSACGGGPVEAGGGSGEAPGATGRSDAAERAADSSALWRSLRERASFDSASAGRVDAASAARLPPDAVLAWSEAQLGSGGSAPREVRAAIASRRDPAVQRALLLGHVQSGAAAEEAELVAALESADPALREAAVLVCARSAARALPERTLGREVLSREELELLDAPAEQSEPPWNRITGAWVEQRFRAALRHGSIDGRPGSAFAEEELRADASFLREVALAAISAEQRAALAPHFAAEVAREIAPDLLARLLGTCEAEALFPGGATLSAERVERLRAALLSPACSDATVRRVLELAARLPDDLPWRGAVLFAGGELAAGLALRRRFEELRRDDALACLVVLGRSGRSEALAILSELAHPSREVGWYVFAARVACGDFAPLDLVFARALEGADAERLAALDALLATGAVQRQRDWITEHSRALGAVDTARLAYAWGSRELMSLIALLGEEVPSEWGALAVDRLLENATAVPPALASGWPRGASRPYDRSLAAALARAKAPRGLGLLEDALRELETDGALLAAAVLLEALGVERGGEVLRAALLTATAADEQARLGWIAGRLLGASALSWMPGDANSSDPARDAAALGAAAAAVASRAGGER